MAQKSRPHRHYERTESLHSRPLQQGASRAPWRDAGRSGVLPGLINKAETNDQQLATAVPRDPRFGDQDLLLPLQIQPAAPATVPGLEGLGADYVPLPFPGESLWTRAADCCDGKELEGVPRGAGQTCATLLPLAPGAVRLRLHEPAAQHARDQGVLVAQATDPAHQDLSLTALSFFNFNIT